MPKPKIKDLLKLLGELTEGIKGTSKANQSVQALGRTTRSLKSGTNLQAANRSGMAAGHIADVIRENARMVSEHHRGNLPSLNNPNISGSVRKTTKRVQGYERVVKELANNIKDKSLLASFPRQYAERMDSYIDKYQRMLKDVERNAEMSVNRVDMRGIKSDIRESYKKVQEVAEKIYSGGYLDNKPLTAEEQKQALVLITQLEIENDNIDKINKSVKKSTRMSESIADIAERKKEHYNRVINNTFQNIQNIGRSFSTSDVVGMASGAYGIARMGIKAASQKKAGFEGEAALMKQLGGLAGAMGKLAMLKIVLEGMKALVSGAAYFSDKAAELNTQLTEVHGLASQGIPMGIDVNYDQVKDSFTYYRDLLLNFGADTKTWLQPDELLAITGAMEPYGIMLQNIAGSQEDFNKNMLNTVRIALEAGMEAPEMAGNIAEFSQQFGVDMKTASAYLDVFQKSAREADIPSRFLIEGIKSASADLSVAGENIILSMELQKKNLTSGNSNLLAGEKAFEAYKNALDNMTGTDLARLRDQLGGDALSKEAERKLANVKKDINSGMYSGDSLTRLEHQAKQLDVFLKLDRGEQSLRFQSVVGFSGVHNLVKQYIEKEFPNKLNGIIEGTETFTDAEEIKLRTVLGQVGVSDKDFDTVMLGVINSLEVKPEEIQKKLDALKAAQKDANQSSQATSDTLAKYMTQQTKLSDITQSAFNKLLGQILKHTENILGGLKKHWLLKQFGGGTEAEDKAEQYQRVYNQLLDKIMQIAQMEPGKDRLNALYGLNGLLGEFKSAGGDFQDLYAEMQQKGIPEDILTRLKGAYDKVAAKNFNNLGGSNEYGDKALALALDQAGITDPTERAAFLGQMAHESGNFNFNEEQISKEKAEATMGYKSVGNKKGGLGNTEEGDGYKYRGRGYVQLTGKWNYAHYGKKIGVDLVNNPDLAARPDIASQIAIAYWKERVRPNVKDYNNTRAVTSGINSGLNHLKEREAAFRRYKGSALTQVGAVTPESITTPPPKPTAPKVPGTPPPSAGNTGGTGKAPKVPPKTKTKSTQVNRKRILKGTLPGKPDNYNIRANMIGSNTVTEND